MSGTGIGVGGENTGPSSGSVSPAERPEAFGIGDVAKAPAFVGVGPSLPAIEMTKDILRRNLKGEHVGIFSVCSAHPQVIEAAIAYAAETGRAISIQGTCNQFDPGRRGYTGRTPQEFFDGIRALAQEIDLSLDRILLAGDHLGTFLFTKYGPAEAMALAVKMVEAFVEGGAGLIHLDPSVGVKGDPIPLSTRMIAQRAAEMCRAAEEKSSSMGFKDVLLYVVGTEVPTPGGSAHEEDSLKLTTPEAIAETMRIHREEFEKAGVGHVFAEGRVVLAVTQPGAEFAAGNKVFKFDPEKAKPLGQALRELEVCGDFHSTDYTTEEQLRAGVELGFANLKVGPECTWALGQAIFALEEIERQLVPEGDRAGVTGALVAAMQDNPKYWRGYGTAEQLAAGEPVVGDYLDRQRYYWPVESVDAAVQKLYANVTAVLQDESKKDAALALLKEHLPNQEDRLNRGKIPADAKLIARDRVRDVLVKYDRACNPDAFPPGV